MAVPFYLQSRGAVPPRARIRMRALTAHRKVAAMPEAAERTDIHQPLNVRRHLAPEIALDLHAGVDELPNLHQLVVVHGIALLVQIDPRLRQDLAC